MNKEMRQRGSQRVRRRPASHGNENSGNPTLSEATPHSMDQSADATSKRCSDADENVTEMPAPSDDAVNTAVAAARDYLRRLNERRTRSERYFLQFRLLLHMKERGSSAILQQSLFS